MQIYAQIGNSINIYVYIVLFDNPIMANPLDKNAYNTLKLTILKSIKG